MLKYKDIFDNTFNSFEIYYHLRVVQVKRYSLIVGKLYQVNKLD